MPGSQRSLRITDTYRARLVALRDRTVAVARARWSLEREDLEGSYSTWTAITQTTVAVGQRAGVVLTGAYLGAFLTSELGGRAGPELGEVDRYVGRARDGRSLEGAFTPPLYTVKRAIREGESFNRAAELGLARALRSVARETIGAAREFLDDQVLDDERIVGWTRVAAGGCGACLAAATGAIQAGEELLAVHDGCRCTKEPVIRGVAERASRPNGQELFEAMPSEEQDQLLGPIKAELVRSGDVPFDALITRSPMAAIDDQITEAPLEVLRQ